MNVWRILHRLLIVSAASSGLIWSPAPAAEGSEIGSRPYHLTRLGPFQGARLNNRGEVIGSAPTANHGGWGSFAALYHSYGERAGAVDAILGPESDGTSGLLLNDRGQTVIQNLKALDDPTAPWTLFWDGSEARGIEPEGQRVYFDATAINNSGTVVGTTYDPVTGDTQPVLWSDGQITPLADSPRFHFGRTSAINDLGQVVGTADELVSDPSEPWTRYRSRAVLWEDGKEVDLGTLGGDFFFADATDINNAGQVVGTTDFRAFLWQAGTMTALDVPGHAVAINSAGDVLGVGWDFDDYGGAVPWVYSDGSFVLLQDLLPPPEFGFVGYIDFNDLGQILGFVIDWERGHESFLLTPGSMEAPAPVTSIPTVIPEPTTVAMMCLVGAASLARGVYRKAKGRPGRRGA